MQTPLAEYEYAGSPYADVTRDRYVSRMYGIGLDAIRRMEVEQRGMCAICGSPETVKSRNGCVKQLSVDHCHATGQVRGLLCVRCNAGLGYFRDDPEALIAAADYLRMARAQS